MRSKTVTGRLSCHPSGYGFVTPEDSSSPDIFIPAKNMKNATDGDIVVAAVRPSRRRGRLGKGRPGPRLEGEIVSVVSRARATLVGKLTSYRDELYVAPLDLRYHYSVGVVGEVPREAVEGKIVVVTIVAQPGRHQMPLGQITEVLGDPGDPEIQYRIVCHQQEIPVAFQAATLAEAEAAGEPGASEIARREDCRELPTVTIDGETARDFDDAVSIRKKEGGGFTLWVHIADVSHYVRPGTALNEEALRRGTSVYFPDRAVPMLPPALSTDLCSLRPRIDRLTVSVEMDLDEKGRVVASRFYDSVICSRERMTYTDVAKIVIDRDPDLRRRYEPLLQEFDWMLELSRLLSAERAARGAIDFDLPEPEIVYDVSGEVLDIIQAARNDAHRIIEEFMLAANEAVAGYLTRQELPLLYRIHEEPEPAKVEDFLETAKAFGYGMERSGKSYQAADFQKMAAKFGGSPVEKFLSYIMLRSFKQARYSELNHGHFGLATRLYTHFTSPIRRYPDLIVHRILKWKLHGREGSSEAQELYEELPEIAVHSSDRERRAVEAERAIMKWIMAEFMAQRLGDEFEGFITGVKHNGFFVQLFDHFVEGFVPVETIWDDFYVLQGTRLVGEVSRKAFRPGDRVHVRVDKVNRDRRLIDFSLVLPEQRSRRRR